MTPEPTIAPTSARQVLLAVVVGAGVSWLVSSTLQAQGMLPPVSAVAWVSPWLLAGGWGVLAWRTRTLVRTRRADLDATNARNTVLLGKAGILAGAALAAAWGVLAAVAAPGLPAPLPLERVINSGLACVGSIALAIAGWFVERSCRIPDPPEGGEERDMRGSILESDGDA